MIIYVYTMQLVTAWVRALKAATVKITKPSNVFARTGWILLTWTWKRFAFPSLSPFGRRRTFEVGAPFFLFTTCNPMVAMLLGPTKCHCKGQMPLETCCRTCTSSLPMRPSCLHDDATLNHYMTFLWHSYDLQTGEGAPVTATQPARQLSPHVHPACGLQGPERQCDQTPWNQKSTCDQTLIEMGKKQMWSNILKQMGWLQPCSDFWCFCPIKLGQTLIRSYTTLEPL